MLFQSGVFLTPTVLGSNPTNATGAAQTACAESAQRLGWRIQNLGTVPLFVKYGPGASAANFDLILSAGTAVDNGTGAAKEELNGADYTGIVTVFGAAVGGRWCSTSWLKS